MQGSLDTYRFCDDVWSFMLRDVTFKFSKQDEVKTKKVKIVACSSKKSGEA